MARRSPTSPDEASSIVAGTFTATGNSASSAFFPGGLNCSIWGTFVGTVGIERSFDGGATFIPIEKDLAGTNLTFTAPDSVIVEEVESAVLYRAVCSAFTSGTINYRLSQG